MSAGLWIEIKNGVMLGLVLKYGSWIICRKFRSCNYDAELVNLGGTFKIIINNDESRKISTDKWLARLRGPWKRLKWWTFDTIDRLEFGIKWLARLQGPWKRLKWWAFDTIDRLEFGIKWLARLQGPWKRLKWWAFDTIDRLEFGIKWLAGLRGP